MRVLLGRRWLIFLGIGAALTLNGCGRQKGNDMGSKILVTDVGHTAVKRQSISNCWLYAASSWLESLILLTTGNEADVSESYWTWWHFYHQLIDGKALNINSDGGWELAAELMLRHGYVLEDEFLPHEAGLEMSEAQVRAEAFLNEQLQPGGGLSLPSLRTPSNVRYYLDLAFGSHMAQTEAYTRRAEESYVALSSSGERITLAQALRGNRNEAWTKVPFPRIGGQYVAPNPALDAARAQVYQRVFRALNQHMPVVMSLKIDFNALDPADGTFKASRLRRLGPGPQGGHMVALKDYTVDNVPGYGNLGRGEMPEEVKAAAVYGTPYELIAKNSWGTNRLERGVTDGYTAFEADFLNGQFAWRVGGETSNRYEWNSSAEAFLLPPGF